MNNITKNELIDFLYSIKDTTIKLSTELKYINGTGELIYATDIETNIIIFANDEIKLLFGDIVGKKCYEALHNLYKPCPFCNNNEICNNINKPNTWIYKNNKLNKLFFIIDICKVIDNRLVRIEKAYEISENIIKNIYL
jgi:hypothetical protein